MGGRKGSQAGGTGGSRRSKKTRRRLPRWADRLVTVLIICVGVGLLVWPWVADWLDSRGATSQITSVTENIDSLSEEDRALYLSQARAYNAILANDAAALAQTGLSAEDVWPYDDQLTFNHDPMMSWVEIPSINVSMPIYHGTSDDALAAGVGHLEWTSLPVGGASTHCVLTAHSGMRNARMFDDIRQLEEGDIVLLHTMGETLAYAVHDSETVLPTEIDSLSISEGADEVTLITCTPYGINTHRLLVHCYRTTYNPDEAAEQSSLTSRHWGAREIAVLVVLVALAGLVADVLIHRHGSARRKKRGSAQGPAPDGPRHLAR